MNYFNRIPVPITYSSEEKVKEVYLRTFPDNEMHLLQDSYTFNKQMKEKCTLIWFNPGKCFYQFIVNSIKHLNPKKPIEKVNNEFFNVLFISKDIPGMEVKVTSTDLTSNFKLLIGKDKEQSLSKDENCLLTLSVKAENHIQEIGEEDKSIQLLSFNENNLNEDSKESNEPQANLMTEMVIVYSFNNCFLVEMNMTPYQSDNPDLICLKSTEHPELDIAIVNKNDIFYQKTMSFDKAIDLSQLKTVNELTVMKAIHTSFLEKKNYIIAHEVMMIFYSSPRSSPNSELLLPSAMINAFISIGNSSMILIKGRETQELMKAIKESNDSMTDSLLANVFSLTKLMKDSTMLHILIKNREVQFNLLPVISSQEATPYNSKSILLHIEPNKNKLVKISSEASKEIHKIRFNKEDEEVILEFCNYNARAINVLYNIMTKSNMLHLFKHFFQGLFICYSMLVHYRNSTEDSTDYVHEQNSNEHLLIYYSNVLVLTIIRTLLQLIPLQMKSTNKCKPPLSRSFLLIHCNNDSSDKESALFLNDVIYRRHSSTQALTKTNCDLISNVLLKHFNESISKWKSQISNYISNEILFKYESLFTSLQLFKSIQGQFAFGKEPKPKLVNLLAVNIQKSFILLQTAELSNSPGNCNKFKQLLYVPISSYEEFLFSSKEHIISFIHYNRLIEYANDSIQKPFSFLSCTDFIKAFLPLLGDISSSQANVTNLQNRITHFIIDLQTIQKINERFEVNAVGVSFGFQTFETMIELIRTLKNDKAVLLQANYRRYLIENVVRKMRRSSVILQRKWRSYFYTSMTATYGNEDVPSYLINKFKKKDALLIQYLIGIKRMTSALSIDNTKLKQRYALVNCQRSTNFNLKGEMTTKRSNYELNSSSFSSFLANNQKASNSLHKIKTDIKHINSHNPLKLKETEGNRALIDEDNGEIKALNEKIEESKRKYKDMILLASEYEKKIDGLISFINSKEEVREILKKTGVKFN